MPKAATTTTTSRSISVRGVPIDLCQFVKLGGLTDSGGEAKHAIREGRVLLNGVVETRKGKQLATGDKVTLGDHTIIVALA